MADIDHDRLHMFVGKMLGDLGGAYSVPTARIGFRLGLFQSLDQDGPATAAVLAERLRLAPRYVQEWALAQAANGYVTHDPGTGRFSLNPEQAMVFANKDSPVYLEGAFDLAAAMIEGEPKVEQGFRTGDGVAWGDSAGCLFCAVGAFFRPGYVNSIVQSWLPSVEGALPRLERGARVADVGCGVGFSTLLMAKAFPRSAFVGYDFHAPSIEQANAHAVAHGLADRVRFETAHAKEIADDPVGAIHSLVTRLYYNASTMICVPTSLAQEVGAALGAQAGERRLTKLLKGAGFDHVRRAAEGPFNMVLEARP